MCSVKTRLSVRKDLNILGLNHASFCATKCLQLPASPSFIQHTPLNIYSCASCQVPETT